VTKLPVANQIDNNILQELLTELGCELKGSLHILHTVSIHMEDWRVDGLCDISGVDTRPTFVWSSSEPNLVIDYHVNCTANVIVC
jgi:hypothetical protein